MLRLTGHMNGPKLPGREETDLSLSGMTGFARLAETAEWGQWVWEARSVNGRTLDLRFNLPAGFETLENDMRKQASSKFSRGSLQISLRYTLNETVQKISIREDILSQLVRAYENQAGHTIGEQALATLMGFNGVVVTQTQPASERLAEIGVLPELRRTGFQLLDEVELARRQEGQALETLLLGLMKEMQALIHQARSEAAMQSEVISQRYQARLKALDTDPEISPERLALEVALLAGKADVTEELDRLQAHLDRGHQLLSQSEPIGRDLGFLIQELNREANTLCAKSAVLDLTNTGLALKSVMDQIREQAANVE